VAVLTIAEIVEAEKAATLRGHTHLAETFRKMRVSMSTPKPVRRTAGKPRLCFVFNNKTWCDGRLSTELSTYLSWDYQCRMLDSTDQKYFSYEDDIYFFRNVGSLSTAPPPAWASDRIICMLESERPLLLPNFVRRYEYTSEVFAQNILLRDQARALGVKNVSDLIIGNGVNTVEFTPAREYPEEFTVGACGNFSSEAFDEWKGFGRYIVPACKMANVKLRWCGWQGMAHSLPGIEGEQVPLDKMNDWYRGLSCLVSMSKAEGCSGVVFEAMATGLPVISTKVGWHGDMCKDEILWTNRPVDQAPQNDKVAIEELAHRILWVKNNQAAARAIGMRARKFAEAWPHSRIAEQWRGILSKIAIS
jgi:glycosyltransferase involved in cell wall biosynthesis